MIPPRERRWRDGGPETVLPRGDVTEGVVRVGDTVRRPHQAQSWAVAEYLDHLEAVGFDGSPRFLGLDDQGRDVLTFLDGDVAEASPSGRSRIPCSPHWESAEHRRARRRGGGFVDFDLAGPGTRYREMCGVAAGERGSRRRGA